MENLTAFRDKATGQWHMEGVEPWQDTYNRIVGMLKSNEQFKFARWGDGEWNCLFGKVGKNCDGHIYYQDLGESLRRIILSDPKYLMGIQPLSMSYERSEQIKEFCRDLQVTWVNADAIHNASINKQLGAMMEAVRSRYTILVGPPHLAGFFDYGVHIVIPPINCWLEYEKIREQLEFHLDGAKDAVVILAASMMSEVLIDDFAEHTHTFVDIGSVLDPYCGVRSRKYHFKLSA